MSLRAKSKEKIEANTGSEKIKDAEEDFYRTFAEWLKDDVQQAVDVMVVGDSFMRQNA
jgi:hypothetical protein